MNKEVGLVPITDFANSQTAIDFRYILNSIFKLNLNNRVLNEIDYTYDRYLEFLELYEKVNDKKLYDETMQTDEILYLHSAELKKEEKEKFIDTIANNVYTESSIEYMSNKQLQHGKILIPNIKRLHNILFNDIVIEKEYDNFRLDDNKFVGYFVNENEKYVQYYPPLASDIDKSMNELITYLNDPSLDGNNPNTYIDTKDIDFHKKYALFISPLITQAMLAIIQPFDDGNTRTAKVMNYANMLKRTNDYLDKKYNLPKIYFSKFYMPYLQQYREYIASIAVNPNDDNWNKWFMLGLHTMQDYMDYGENFIEENNLISSKKVY